MLRAEQLRELRRNLGVCLVIEGETRSFGNRPGDWADASATPPPRPRSGASCVPSTRKGCLPACRVAPTYREPASAIALEGHELFSPHAPGTDPQDAVYVRRAMTRAHMGLPAHSWVEVTHCVSSSAWAATPLAQEMWFFVAPGSGVSIYLGNTVVLDEPLMRARGYGGSLWDIDVDIRQLKVQRRGRLHEYLMKEGGLSAAEVAALDTIQRIQHHEANCMGVRQEIVMLTGRPDFREDMQVLTAAQRLPDRIKCGRHPWLYPCTPQSPGPQKMRVCTGANKGRDLLAGGFSPRLGTCV